MVRLDGIWRVATLLVDSGVGILRVLGGEQLFVPPVVVGCLWSVLKFAHWIELLCLAQVLLFNMLLFY